jgi:YD repeat-containing protein
VENADQQSTIVDDDSSGRVSSVTDPTGFSVAYACLNN